MGKIGYLLPHSNENGRELHRVRYPHSLSEMSATIILFMGHVGIHFHEPETLGSPIEVIEKGEQVESKLDETLLLVYR